MKENGNVGPEEQPESTPEWNAGARLPVLPQMSLFCQLYVLIHKSYKLLGSVTMSITLVCNL